MHFEDFNSFIDMGGYGLYVWLSFAAALISLALVWLDSALTKQKLFKQILQEQARQQRIQTAKTNQTVDKPNDETEK
jgi:heme exporter protein D